MEKQRRKRSNSQTSTYTQKDIIYLKVVKKKTFIHNFCTEKGGKEPQRIAERQ